MKRKPIMYAAIALVLSARIFADMQTDLIPLTVRLGNKVEQTGGFFDLAGATYPSKAQVITISDETHPNPVKKRQAFTRAISGDKSKVILLEGTLDLSDGKISDSDHSYYDAFDKTTHKRLHADIVFDIGSNTTILGTKNARIAFGGLRIKASEKQKAENIIIRNVEFYDAHGSTEYDTSVPEYKNEKASADQLVVEGTFEKGKYTSDYIPRNIWIDHCTFSDGTCRDLSRNFNHDGALDVKAVHNMTISFCEFHNHDKVTLIAPSDKFTNPTDRQITIHHNYYHDATQRMPRTRGCEVHLYNNVYDKIGNPENSGYSISPGIGAQFIVENNVFGQHAGKMILRCADKSKPGDATFYKLFASGNIPELSEKNAEDFARHSVSEKPFAVPYKYSLEDAKSGERTTLSNAGSILEITVE